jgi:GNAT superfamily N-acetyltransferase
MPISDITFDTFRTEHIAGAVALSRKAGWPHRAEDWALGLGLSQGVVILAGERVLGTAFMTPYGAEAATINMVIVDEACRGQGLGRRLMQRCIDAADGRVCRLIATAEGLPLYEKLGFARTGEITQYQGIVAAAGPMAPDARIVWRADDAARAACVAMDRAANGMDRARLIDALFAAGGIACLVSDDRITGFAALRAFGLGAVAGPIIAADAAGAEALLGFLLAECQGLFLRIDTRPEAGLVPMLQAHGLVHVGGGIAMRRGAAAETLSFHSFALPSQALG